MPFYKKIIGDRLYLSPFDPGDAVAIKSWAEWMNDQVIADQFGGHHQLISLSSATRAVSELKGYRFAIVLLSDDTLLGHISLHDIDLLNRNAFLGIVIGDTLQRNKGYGKEAIELVLEFGFFTLNLHSVMLSVLANNPQAIACYKKAGFREAGIRREWAFRNGAYVDKVYMQVLCHEFAK